MNCAQGVPSTVVTSAVSTTQTIFITAENVETSAREPILSVTTERASPLPVTVRTAVMKAAAAMSAVRRVLSVVNHTSAGRLSWVQAVWNPTKQVPARETATTATEAHRIIRQERNWSCLLCQRAIFGHSGLKAYAKKKLFGCEYANPRIHFLCFSRVAERRCVGVYNGSIENVVRKNGNTYASI